MTEWPARIFGATSIRDKCSECDHRPVGVATYQEDPKTMVFAWACDEHLPRLAAFLRDQGVDHEQHIFEITRTCLATGLRRYALRGRWGFPRSPDRRPPGDDDLPSASGGVAS